MIICVTVPEICRVTNINIFHFGLFLALLPCNCLKNENFKKMKKHLEISAFNTIVPNIMITCFTLPEIRHMTEVKIKTSKKFKIHTRRYRHFTHVYLPFWLDDVWFLRYGAVRMDGQAVKQKKWHIEVGAPPKNGNNLYEHWKY